MTMQRPALVEIVRNDPRYAYEAYEFMFEALAHAQKIHGRAPADGESEPGPEQHVSCRELSHGVIDFARQEFGLLARVVFHQWGIRRTDDVGEIVFNLIEAELLCKRESDHRSDFQNICDLDRALSDGFAIDLDDTAFSKRGSR